MRVYIQFLAPRLKPACEDTCPQLAAATVEGVLEDEDLGVQLLLTGGAVSQQDVRAQDELADAHQVLLDQHLHHLLSTLHPHGLWHHRLAEGELRGQVPLLHRLLGVPPGQLRTLLNGQLLLELLLVILVGRLDSQVYR